MPTAQRLKGLSDWISRDAWRLEAERQRGKPWERVYSRRTVLLAGSPWPRTKRRTIYWRNRFAVRIDRHLMPVGPFVRLVTGGQWLWLLEYERDVADTQCSLAGPGHQDLGA